MRISRKFSKLIVILLIVANIIFTSSVLWIFLKISEEPQALIICAVRPPALAVGSVKVAWFAFTTGELYFLSWRI